MANKIITSSTDIASLIATGLNDGENITINFSAKLTVDVSPSVLIGQIVINEGEMLLDGANAVNPIVFVGESLEEINVNGAGILRSTLGWWEFPTTSDGTASQTFDCSTYFTSSIVNADVFSGVWVETGRRINYDTGVGIAPVVGDWLFAVSDQTIHGRIVEVSGDGTTGYVVVKFLTGSLADNDTIELHTIQDNKGPEYQKSWTATANGADVLEPDVYQGFGNVYQNSTNYLTSMGTGIAGFAFSQLYQSNTLTFGDGTNGFIPPDGAKIRVPMVHFCTGTIASIALNDTVWETLLENTYELETNNGGDCFLDGVSLGSTQFEDNFGTKFEASFCAVNGSFGVYGALERSSYDECIFVSNIINDSRSSSRSIPAIVDLVNGADVRDCIGIFMNDTSETTYMGCQTSLGVNYERTIQIGNGLAIEFEIQRSSGFTINDLVVIGTQATFFTAVDGDVTLLKTQQKIIPDDNPTFDSVLITGNSADIKLTGWEVLNGSTANDSKVAITDSTRIKIYGFHFIDGKFDNETFGLTNQGEEFASIGGLCSDITLARCWMDRGNPNEFVLQVGGTTKNLTVLNCSGEYNGEVDPDGINTSYRGLHGGSGNLGANTGLETDYPGTAGAHFGDIFESDTKGYIYYRNVPGSVEYPTIILAGSPTFTKDGDVDIKLGDQWEVDMGYVALGHTSFSGVVTTTRNGTLNAEGLDTWTGVDIDFQYDTGAGYNGSWLDLRTPVNLTGITDTIDGVRLKLRFTGNTTQTNGQALTIHTTTTIADQRANLHPIEQVQVTFIVTDVLAGSIIEIYDNEITNTGNNDTKLVFTNNSGTSFSYVHNGTTNDVRVQVIKNGFVEVIQDFQLLAVDQSLPINQKVELND